MLELGGMMLVGDGVLALLQPRGHVALWSQGPWAWRRMIAPFRASPALTRAGGLLEIGLGLWLAAREQHPGPASRLG